MHNSLNSLLTHNSPMSRECPDSVDRKATVAQTTRLYNCGEQKSISECTTCTDEIRERKSTSASVSYEQKAVVVSTGACINRCFA